MHELSIVMNIVAIAEKEATKVNASAVTEIELDIGCLSAIDMPAFDLAWMHGIKHTLLENALRKVNRIDGFARCNTCENLFTMSEVYEACPVCNSHYHEVLQGKELSIKSMVVTQLNNN